MFFTAIKDRIERVAHGSIWLKPPDLDSQIHGQRDPGWVQTWVSHGITVWLDVLCLFRSQVMPSHLASCTSPTWCLKLHGFENTPSATAASSVAGNHYVTTWCTWKMLTASCSFYISAKLVMTLPWKVALNCSQETRACPNSWWKPKSAWKSNIVWRSATIPCQKKKNMENLESWLLKSRGFESRQDDLKSSWRGEIAKFAGGILKLPMTLTFWPGKAALGLCSYEPVWHDPIGWKLAGYCRILLPATVTAVLWPKAEIGPKNTNSMEHVDMSTCTEDKCLQNVHTRLHLPLPK